VASVKPMTAYHAKTRFLALLTFRLIARRFGPACD
jgi:hypothetical protein